MLNKQANMEPEERSDVYENALKRSDMSGADVRMAGAEEPKDDADL